MLDARRRDFITLLGGVAVAWPLAVRAQQPTRIARLGILLFSTRQADSQVEPMRRALRDLGYVDGHNISIEYRYAEGKLDRLPDLAAALVRAKPDVLFATRRRRGTRSHQRYADVKSLARAWRSRGAA